MLHIISIAMCLLFQMVNQLLVMKVQSVMHKICRNGLLILIDMRKFTELLKESFTITVFTLSKSVRKRYPL
jgi:hypothetical protein